MLKINTRTTSTICAADGTTISCEDLFEAIRKAIEVKSHTGNGFRFIEDEEDQFQEAAYKALKYSESYDSTKSAPSTWASWIATNTRRDAFARYLKSKERFAENASQSGNGGEYVCQTFPGYRGDEFESDRALRTKEAMSHISAAFDTLSECQQDIIRRVIDGYSVKEIAEEFNFTKETIYQLTFKARKDFKEALGREFLREYGISL